MGNHIDKIPWDAPDGTHTMPVLLGEHAARVLTQAMMVSFYVLVLLLVGLGSLPIGTLLVLLALPKLVTIWEPRSRSSIRDAPARCSCSVSWPGSSSACERGERTLKGARDAREHDAGFPADYRDGPATRRTVHGDSAVVTFEGDDSRRATFTEVAGRAEKLVFELHRHHLDLHSFPTRLW